MRAAHPVVGLLVLSCSTATAPPLTAGTGCTSANSTVYDATLGAWVTNLYQQTITYQEVTDKAGRLYRQTVLGCAHKGCIKLDPNKTLTAQQAAANCTI